MLAQVVKNTNITINLSVPTAADASTDSISPSLDSPTTTPTSQVVKADIVQLISDLERVSATLKKINQSVGQNHTEVFFMIQNFDTILNSVKMVVNAV